MKYFQKQRLLKLADFLESLPRNRFDLSIIARENEEGERPDVKTCGTAACAIGWTPIVFPEHCRYTPSWIYNLENRDLTVCSKDGTKKDFDFAEDFFGLNEQESCFLFMPESYPENRRGKVSVANRIRKFVAGKVDRLKIEEAYGW